MPQTELKLDAIKFKEEAQRRVQKELSGLSGQAYIKAIRSGAVSGPLGKWMKQLKRIEASPVKI